MESRPIFIIGSPRSGTSIITSAITRGANIPGYTEGHFLPLINTLMTEVNDYYSSREQLLKNQKLAIANANIQKLENKILGSFRTVYDSLFTETVWVDKTPGIMMVRTSPYLLRAWPQARFIFAKRRGIECIQSRLKKFPRETFKIHCNKWRFAMEAWCKVKDDLKDHYLEIDQREIGLNPEQVSSELGNFLDLSAEKINQIYSFFRSNRPEHTGGNETQQAIDIEHTNWSQEDIDYYQETCQSICNVFGYSDTSSYYR